MRHNSVRLRHLPATLLGFALVVTLAACNSDKVTWSFVSDTGASGGSGGIGGGAIIVIRSNGNFAQTGSGSERILTFEGSDGAGPLTARLLTGGETVVLERPGSVAIRSAALTGEIDLGPARIAARGDAACLQIDGFPADRLEPGATGSGRLTLAAAGTLLVLEHPAGLVARDAAARVQRFGPGWTLAIDAQTFRAVAPDGGRFERLVPTPAPPPAARMRQEGERVELLGPAGQLVARIPRAAVTLHGGLDGRFLTASFPAGLDGVRGGPFALTVPADSRYVLRVDF